VEDDAGRHGWGDAAPWRGFGDWRRADELEAALRNPSDEAPVEARHAWQLARLDLEARSQGHPLSSLLTERPAASVPVHTLVRDGEEAIRAVALGATHLKIKVGRGSIAADDGRVWEIRASAGPAPRLRLDANGAWDVARACEAIARLKQWDIEWIEQPVPPGDPAALATVRRETGIPVAADESIVDEASLDALVAAHAIDVAVIKPMFLGGPREAYLLALRAQAAGLKVVITHAFGSPIERAAALHVAAALGETAIPCGVGTAPHGPRLIVPTVPGLGLEGTA
jgi:L-alanine-DL-glutamate epimerase-like enolase superfamily enzyme